MRRIKFTVPPEYDGKKVLNFLRGRAGLSARLVNSLKRTPDGITLNGAHTRTVDIMRTGDVLAVCLPDDETHAEPSEIKLDIIYEDSDILVVNKPAGLAMHPTHNHQGDTLANAAAAYFLKKNEKVTFRAIGRLDKCTSGIVICALNRYAAARLSGGVKKTYYAIAGGKYEGSGTIDAPIIRPDAGKTLRAVGEGGERAVTHWRAVLPGDDASLLLITLETGRTHQIRVHFASLGTPLCGDDMYGSSDFRIARAALHCAVCELKHPVTGEMLRFEAPLPEDMVKIIADGKKSENI